MFPSGSHASAAAETLPTAEDLAPGAEPWQRLVDSLELELVLLRRLRDLADTAREPLMQLEVSRIEELTTRQQRLLAELAEVGAQRRDAQLECLPPTERGLVGTGQLAAALTLHSLVRRAPHDKVAVLRSQRDRLRQLRDEVAVVTTRNELLIRQVLLFADHLGNGLAESTREEGYDASGERADATAAGELFSRAL